MLTEVTSDFKDPAEQFLQADHLQFKRQRLNSGSIVSQQSLDSVAQGTDDVIMDYSKSSAKKQSKGFLFLALALGMMCCNSSLVAPRPAAFTSQQESGI